MKKLILLLLFIPLVSFSQWRTIETVDEFGDKTGESLEVYQVKGTFSNSATTNSESILTLKMQGDIIQFSIQEYNDYPATYLCDNIILSVKIKSGEVFRKALMYSMNSYIVDDFYGYKYGGDVFALRKPSAKRQKWIQKRRSKGEIDFFSLISTYNGVIKMVITCGGTTYKFNIEGYNTK